MEPARDRSRQREWSTAMARQTVRCMARARIGARPISKTSCSGRGCGPGADVGRLAQSRRACCSRRVRRTDSQLVGRSRFPAGPILAGIRGIVAEIRAARAWARLAHVAGATSSHSPSTRRSCGRIIRERAAAAHAPDARDHRHHSRTGRARARDRSGARVRRRRVLSTWARAHDPHRGRKEAPGRPLLYATTREVLGFRSDWRRWPALREMGDGAESSSSRT